VLVVILDLPSLETLPLFETFSSIKLMHSAASSMTDLRSRPLRFREAEVRTLRVVVAVACVEEVGFSSREEDRWVAARLTVEEGMREEDEEDVFAFRSERERLDAPMAMTVVDFSLFSWWSSLLLSSWEWDLFATFVVSKS